MPSNLCQELVCLSLYWIVNSLCGAIHLSLLPILPYPEQIFKKQLLYRFSAELDFFSPTHGAIGKRNKVKSSRFLSAVIMPCGHLMRNKQLSNLVKSSHPHKDPKPILSLLYKSLKTLSTEKSD